MLKRILPHLAEDPQFVEMFLGEAQLAAQLNHPNIVQIFDFGEAEGSYFIAMEYIDGPNLRTLSAKRAPQAGSAAFRRSARRSSSSACEGLAYAHDFARPATGEPLGLVHRDISPDNILVARSGAVKVVDFGIAKAARPEPPDADRARVKGKVAYMPPEQLRGEPLDRRADVYALGVVLYELLTGRKPFEAGSDASMMRAVLYDAAIPAVRRVPTLPPGDPVASSIISWRRTATPGTPTAARSTPTSKPSFPRPARRPTASPSRGSWRSSLRHPRLPSPRNPRRRAPRRSPRCDGLRVRADLEQPHPPERAAAGPGSSRGGCTSGDPRARPHGALGAATHPSTGGRPRGPTRRAAPALGTTVRLRVPERAGDGAGLGDAGAHRAGARGLAHAHHRHRAPREGRRLAAACRRRGDAARRTRRGGGLPRSGRRAPHGPPRPGGVAGPGGARAGAGADLGAGRDADCARSDHRPTGAGDARSSGRCREHGSCRRPGLDHGQLDHARRARPERLHDTGIAAAPGLTVSAVPGPGTAAVPGATASTVPGAGAPTGLRGSAGPTPPGNVPGARCERRRGPRDLSGG